MYANGFDKLFWVGLSVIIKSVVWSANRLDKRYSKHAKIVRNSENVSASA